MVCDVIFVFFFFHFPFSFGGHQMSSIQQLEQGNFVLFCTHAAGLRNHFQYLVVTILVSCTSLPNVTWFSLGFGTK